MWGDNTAGSSGSGYDSFAWDGLDGDSWGLVVTSAWGTFLSRVSSTRAYPCLPDVTPLLLFAFGGGFQVVCQLGDFWLIAFCLVNNYARWWCYVLGFFLVPYSHAAITLLPVTTLARTNPLTNEKVAAYICLHFRYLIKV